MQSAEGVVSAVVMGWVPVATGVGVGVGTGAGVVPVQHAPRVAARTMRRGMIAILQFIREAWDCGYLRVVFDHKSVIDGDSGKIRAER
jgi:hypothetical protein